jgi:uncharacterized protein YjiS (DUF1127 family)
MSSFALPHARIAIEPSETLPVAPAAILKTLVRRARRAVAAFRWRRELERLPDRVLRDIGIRREEIGREVDERLDADGRSRGGYPF